MLTPAPSSIVRGALLFLVAAAVSGCSASDGEAVTKTLGTAKAVAAAEIRDEGYDCGYTWDGRTVTWTVEAEAGSVPPGFDAVEAVWCKIPDAPRDWSMPEFSVTEVRTTVLEPLVARFETADDPDDLMGECAELHVLEYIPARIWLLDADGRAMLGHSPTSVCGPNTVGIAEAFPQVG